MPVLGANPTLRIWSKALWWSSGRWVASCPLGSGLSLPEGSDGKRKLSLAYGPVREHGNSSHVMCAACGPAQGVQTSTLRMRGPVTCLRVLGWKEQSEDQVPVCLAQKACLLSGPTLHWHLRLHLTKDICTLEVCSVSLLLTVLPGISFILAQCLRL